MLSITVIILLTDTSKCSYFNDYGVGQKQHTKLMAIFLSILGVGQKQHTKLVAIFLSILNRFSKFFRS